jgi:hypothetical protein
MASPPIQPNSEKPIEFAAFAIDPGETAGWALAFNAELPHLLGIASNFARRKEVCREILQIVGELPLVVVAEYWTIGGPRANYKMFIGLGQSFGRWLDHIEEILGVPEKEIVRPTPQLWRNGLFGSELVRKHSGKGDDLKRLACAYVSPPGFTPITDHNAAEAGCMACWAHVSEEGIEAAERAVRRLNQADPEEDASD